MLGTQQEGANGEFNQEEDSQQPRKSFFDKAASFNIPKPSLTGLAGKAVGNWNLLGQAAKQEATQNEHKSFDYQPNESDLIDLDEGQTE